MADGARLRRTYRYRIYPTVRQRSAIEAQLGFACQLYNAALEQRRYAWRGRHQPVSLYEQFRELTDVRAASMGPANMSCCAMRDPLRRLDRAFAAFFAPGQGWGQAGLSALSLCAALRQPNLGFRLGLPRWSPRPPGHRPRQGEVASHASRIGAGPYCDGSPSGWTLVRLLFAPAIPIAASCRCGTASRGLDLGIQHFATLSTGEQVTGPRAFRAALRKLRLANRRVSRRQKGSHRRQKAGLLLARHHESIRNLRGDHAHKLTRRLVREFGLIAVEDLNICALAKGFLAKHVTDQGWAAFLIALEYKAAEAGTQLIKVAPGGTSQTCSGCGVVVAKPLSERTHKCPDCGLVADRDTNAAVNILRLGLSRRASTWPTGACVA